MPVRRHEGDLPLAAGRRVSQKGGGLFWIKDECRRPTVFRSADMRIGTAG